MDNKYTLAVNKRTARPRSERLRRLGVGAKSKKGNTIIQVGGGSGSGGATGGDGHTHPNKPHLDKLTTQSGYLLIDGVKVKAGHADTATQAVTATQAATATKAGHADTATQADKATTADTAAKAGHADTATNAEKWGGKAFSDYMNQPVRTTDDVAFEKVTTDTVESETFTDGFSGTGHRLGKKGSESHLTVDNLTVRKKMSVNELEIQSISHVGGQLLLTAARCKADAVTQVGGNYKVTFRSKDGEGHEVKNTWAVGDQAIMQTFDAMQNRFFWRLVTDMGKDGDDHYIMLSGTDCASGSTAPMAGDDIVQLGNRNGAAGRTTAIIIAGAGTESPSIAQYPGITTYTLPAPDTRIQPGANLFSGIVNIQPGSGGWENLSGLSEAVTKAISIGGENLLRNTGFDGEYEIIDPNAGVPSDYDDLLKYWTVSSATQVYATENSSSASGHQLTFQRSNYTAKQTITLAAGTYTFHAKSNRAFTASFGGQSKSLAVGAVWHFDLASETTGDFTLTATSSSTNVWEAKLERGNVATDWCPSQQDVDPVAAGFKHLWYLQEALRGNTQVLGGLILSSLIQLGKWSNGTMTQVTAGMNGVSTTGGEVAFWSGGTLAEAVATMDTIKAGGLTTEQWEALKGFVATHDGQMFLRGYIYAQGGVFAGALKAATGTFAGALQAATGSFAGDVKAQRFVMTRFENDTDTAQTVTGAYITGRGRYELPDLAEGEMVTIKWFNPPYSRRYGPSTFTVANPLTGCIAVASATGALNYYKQVLFYATPSLMYEIIGDHPSGSPRTYWSIMKVGDYITDTYAEPGSGGTLPLTDGGSLMPSP